MFSRGSVTLKTTNKGRFCYLLCIEMYIYGDREENSKNLNLMIQVIYSNILFKNYFIYLTVPGFSCIM